MELNCFKKIELSTIEICKDVGCFNGEAWLSDDLQAGRSFCNRLGSGKPLPYVAGLLQWGNIYGKETSFVGCYYMLNKVFVAAGTPQGSFDSGMAVMLDKSSEEVLGMYLVCLYHGETLQWHFKVTGQRATPLPTAYHNDISCYEDGRREYCSKCFCLLLLIPESGHAILPSQLTGISSLAQVVFEANKSMGSVACCLRWVTPPVFCL